MKASGTICRRANQTRSRLRIPLTACTLAILLLAACGRGSGGPRVVSNKATGSQAVSNRCPAKPAVVITAHNGGNNKYAFDQSQVSAPADQPFVICFKNTDNTSHNVQLFTADPGEGGRLIFEPNAAITGVLGPAEAAYPIRALAPGEYFFRCEIHPVVMKGTLTVSG
jgi:plastocyanin